VSPQVNGSTRLYPIIGDPIGYVESPVRLTRSFEEQGHNGICIPMRVTAEDLDAVLSGLAATRNVDGILVTMPHKVAVVAHCATLSERARNLGAVSVMRRALDLTWHGDMLDGIAFVRAQRDRGAQVEGARALLVGAGAAGRAIALELLDARVGELVIHDEVSSRALDLRDLAVQLGGNHVMTGPPDPSGCDLVFNATPLGMEDGDPYPVNPELLNSSMFVGDVIAGHAVTPFIQAAQDAGCNTADGSDMVAAIQTRMVEFFLGR
jgi:shikimate dehydrogenase